MAETKERTTCKECGWEKEIYADGRCWRCQFDHIRGYDRPHFYAPHSKNKRLRRGL